MLSKLYPSYNVLLISRGKKKKIRIRPTKVYVDIPWYVYEFILNIVNEISLKHITPSDVKNKWKNYVKKHSENLTVDGKPFVNVSFLTKHVFAKTLNLIQIRVTWKRFFKYLEMKTQKDFEKLKSDGKHIRSIYNEILMNANRAATFKTFEIEKKIKSKSKKLLNNFFKVLKHTGDFWKIEAYIDSLLFLFKEIERTFSSFSKEWKLFTWQLKTDWMNLHKAWKTIDIPACYFYLRSILEIIIKMVLFHYLIEKSKLSKSQAENCVIVLYNADRMRHLKKIKNLLEYQKWKVDFIKALHKINVKTPNDYRKFISKFSSLIPSVNYKLIELVKKDTKRDGNIENLWVVTSEVIHNQSPLPFYSLYEIKIFKHFLDHYIFQLTLFLDMAIHKVSPRKSEKINFNKLKKIFHNIFRNKNKILKELKLIASSLDEYWFDINFLSIFIETCWGASHSKLYANEITYKDFILFTEEVASLSYKIGLDLKIKTTFEIICKKLLPFLVSLEKDIKNLNEDEKKTLVLWLVSELFYSP